jgi:hypothetical protein
VEATKSDLQYMELVTKLQQGKMQQKIEDYELGIDGILLYRNKVYVPNSPELRSADFKRNAQCTLCRTPRISENSFSSQEPILLARHEEGDC